ncbi:MAG: hypothetical protein A2W91_15230 [Bacteroidetes bacterium GWF2_38_335]|nr:MAG: hypothetical protein A2W91_15230 [Bacteroidetes bacterium GWF2_38_335]OFY81069.1 MAG: hypothetical protein A2281_13250 [Bacteroidetes bacterium RIFOXYA12_FULL_38_20]HBS87614.1 hypothetical protein [Bacteroidales bacterium]
MKKILLIQILLITAFFGFSQENAGSNENEEIKTLFDGSFTNGGYGSFDMKVSMVNKDAGLLLGGKGGWIINHRLVIGGAGFGLANTVSFTGTGDAGTNTDLTLDFGYGGLMFEYIIMPQNPFHLSVPFVLGAGGATIYEKDPGSLFSDQYYGNALESSGFIVLEPGVDLEINLIKFFRASLGVSYRYTIGSNMNRISDNDLSGISVNMGFKFGLF